MNMSSIASLGWLMRLKKVKFSPVRWGVIKFHVLDPSKECIHHISDSKAPFLSNINQFVLKSPQATQEPSKSWLNAAISSHYNNFSLLIGGP